MKNQVYLKNFGYSVYTLKQKLDKNIDEVFLKAEVKGYKNIILIDYINSEIRIEKINGLNIGKYEKMTTGLFRRLYFYSTGKDVTSEQLLTLIENFSNGKLELDDIITGMVLDKNSLLNKKNDIEFIKSLYLVLLDREPDETGVDKWISLIEKGGSRLKIINDFLNSQEFKTKYTLK